MDLIPTTRKEKLPKGFSYQINLEIHLPFMNIMKYQISVIGCGFVGLCLAVVCANRGVQVFAVDIDQVKINKLKAGQPTFSRMIENTK